MLSGKTLSTVVHQGKTMMDVLKNIPQLNYGNVVFAAEGGRLVLEMDNNFVQNSE